MSVEDFPAKTARNVCDRGSDSSRTRGNMRMLARSNVTEELVVVREEHYAIKVFSRTISPLARFPPFLKLELSFARHGFVNT